MAADLNLDLALEAAAKALHDAKFVRMPDGYLSIRMGTDEENARIAIEAALPHILEAAAAKIEGELVCCDIHERLETLAEEHFGSLDLKPDEPVPSNLHDMSPEWRELRHGPDYHGICHYGAWSAAIVRGLGETATESAASSPVSDLQPTDGLTDTEHGSDQMRAVSGPTSCVDGA